jgi:hypothetical protein
VEPLDGKSTDWTEKVRDAQYGAPVRAAAQLAHGAQFVEVKVGHPGGDRERRLPHHREAHQGAADHAGRVAVGERAEIRGAGTPHGYSLAVRS